MSPPSLRTGNPGVRDDGARTPRTLLLTRRLRPVTWGLAVIAVIGMLAWKATTWESPGTSGDNDQAGAGNIQPGLDMYPVEDRKPAPDLRGSTLEGRDFTLSQWAGSVVVVNVWGSWCVPCRTETPELVQLANELDDRGVRFLGINIRDNPASARSFVDRYDVPYPSLEDPQGRLLLEFANVIPMSVVPSTVVIDRRGDVAARVIGAVTYPTLKGLLQDELLAERGGA
jgi:thiol-disulfide isomerase/thioredoxin